MAVTVYTKPNCPACILTKRKLADLGVAHNELPIDDAVTAEAQAQGITAAPIVRVGEQMWGGFRPDRLSAIAKQLVA